MSALARWQTDAARGEDAAASALRAALRARDGLPIAAFLTGPFLHEAEGFQDGVAHVLAGIALRGAIAPALPPRDGDRRGHDPSAA